MGRSENERFVRIHKGRVPFHLFEFHEEIQPSFEHDFLHPRNSLRLGEKYAEYRLEVGRESGKYIGLKLHRLQMFAPKYAKRVVSPILKSYSYFPALSEKARESRDASISDIDVFLARKRPKYHESPRFYIIMHNGELSRFRDAFNSDDIDGMVVIESNIGPLFLKEFDQIHHMRFDGSEVDTGTSGSQHIRGYEILCSGNRKSRIEVLVS